MKYDIHKINSLEIPEVLGDYLDYIKNILGMSKNTIDGYRIDLIMFFRYMKLYKYLVPSDIEFEDIEICDISVEFIDGITLDDLHSFLKFTEDYRSNGSLTRAKKVASLKSFFKYLYDKKKLINENPTLQLEAPKQAKKQPVYLTLEESQKLLSSIESRNKERDYSIIMLFLNCGIRLSELCNIKIDDIRKDILLVTGKGNRERSIYLNDSCLKSIYEYMKVRDAMTGIKDPEYLFLSEQRTRINKRNF